MLEKTKNYLKLNKILVLILLLSFGLCLFYSFYFQIRPKIDAQGYDDISWNLAQGRGYTESQNGDPNRDTAMTRVGPLYEYFLAGIYSVFGHHWPAVWVVQAILHALGAWLIYLICLQIFKKSDKVKIIGLWAAALFGFYPDLIEISAMVMTETLYLFLFILAVYLFFVYFARRGFFYLILFSLFFGLATLARPPILFLTPVILYFFYKKRLWAQAGCFLVILILVFSPWTIRNYNIFHKVMPFGPAGAFNFWIGNYHGGNGEQEPLKIHVQYFVQNGVSGLQDESIRQFKLFLKEHPAEFLKLTAYRVSKYFSFARPMGFWFYMSGLKQFLFILSSAAFSVILFIAGLSGTIKSLKLKNEKLFYLLGLAILTPLIIFITVVETRYRFQIYPLLAIFAGYFISETTENKRNWWRDKILWSVAAILGANTIIDLIINFGRFYERISQFL